jgi:cation-transporting ATPase E
VFGRVTPQQKREMVHALQAHGHTVAMTGDGVNDVLALKDADIGVAMGSGASATRAVAQLVLLDDQFSHMPGVVGEGRRVIHTIERVANLYLTKNVYSFVLSVSVAITAASYPFLPRQTTIITALTYGIPSFFLALAPHQGRHEEGFLKRVLRFSLPAGAITGAAILAADVLAVALDASDAEAQTASLIAALACGFVVLTLLARPLRPWKVALVATMAGLGFLAVELPFMQDAFDLSTTTQVTLIALVTGLAGGVAIWLVNGRAAKATASPGADVEGEAVVVPATGGRGGPAG